MRKLFVMGVLLLGLLENPSYAIEFCKDVLERGNPGGPSQSLKTWDEEWIIGQPIEVDVDIWVNDVPEQLLTAAFYIDFDPSQMSLVRTEIYDVWDGAMSQVIINPEGPGTGMIVAGNFSLVTPDRDGDIAIAKLRFDCEENCNVQITVQTVPGFDSVVGDSANTYDIVITPNVFTIKEGPTTSTIPGNSCPSETLYGEDSQEVNLLRAFRNNLLSKTREGRELIKLYYQWSPVIVRAMETDAEFKQEIKNIVDQVLPLLSR